MGLLTGTLVFCLLGSVMLLAGILHEVGWFRTGESWVRRRSWASVLLGVFEIILGGILLMSRLERAPVVHRLASIWALPGGLILMGDALRLRGLHAQR